MTIQTEDSYLSGISKIKSMMINRQDITETKGGGWFSKPQTVVTGEEYVFKMDYVREDNSEWTFKCTYATYAGAKICYDRIVKQVIAQDPDREVIDRAFEQAFLKE